MKDQSVEELLKIDHLNIRYRSGVSAVKDVSFALKEGEIVSIVGESGSGKTTLIRGILGLLPSGGQITGGHIFFRGEDLLTLTQRQRQKYRGKEIAMIFQDAGQAMDPIRTIGRQFNEYNLTHSSLDRNASETLALDWMGRMQMADPARVLKSYPFELSGGMKQRSAIAMAMAQNPRLLLADEPTSALDVTIQAQVIYELKKLRDTYGTAIIMVTHNMGAAAWLSDRIGVMKDGQLIEFGPAGQVITQPAEEYTRILLDAVPRLR